MFGWITLTVRINRVMLTLSHKEHKAHQGLCRRGLCRRGLCRWVGWSGLQIPRKYPGVLIGTDSMDMRSRTPEYRRSLLFALYHNLKQSNLERLSRSIQ
jgi:hypothetical protein